MEIATLLIAVTPLYLGLVGIAELRWQVHKLTKRLDKYHPER